MKRPLNKDELTIVVKCLGKKRCWVNRFLPVQDAKAMKLKAFLGSPGVTKFLEGKNQP